MAYGVRINEASVGTKKQRTSQSKTKGAVTRVPARPRKKAGPVTRRTSPQLNADEILNRALRLIRADGVESLSMRKLALSLGVAPMSLYHHVRNRDELIERVLDSLLARIPTPAPQPDGWQQQLRVCGMAILDLLAWHPGIARVITMRPPTAESRRLTRYTAEVLLAAGFDQHKAALCLATYHTFLYGVLSAQAQLSNLLPTVDTHGEPDDGARAVRDELVCTSFRESAQFGIDALLSAFQLQLDAAAALIPRPPALLLQQTTTEPN